MTVSTVVGRMAVGGPTSGNGASLYAVNGGDPSTNPDDYVIVTNAGPDTVYLANEALGYEGSSWSPGKDAGPLALRPGETSPPIYPGGTEETSAAIYAATPDNAYAIVSVYLYYAS